MAVMTPQPMTTAAGLSPHTQTESQPEQYRPQQPFKLAGDMMEKRSHTANVSLSRQRLTRKLSRAKSETALNGIRQLRNLHQATWSCPSKSTMLNCIDGRTVTRRPRIVGGVHRMDDGDDDGLRGLDVLDESHEDVRVNEDVLLLQYTDDESEEDDEADDEEDSLPRRPPSIAFRRRAVSDSKVLVISGTMQYHHLLSPPTVKRVPPRWRIKTTAAF